MIKFEINGLVANCEKLQIAIQKLKEVQILKRDKVANLAN